MPDDLLQKVSKAIEATGFPLELETAAIARRHGWHDFHSVQYPDPDTQKIRELDLLMYKIINGRRIELRVSCKSSTNKQFVFFSRQDTYIHNLGDLKITPVCDNIDERRAVPDALKPLRFYAHGRRAVNYTVLAGDKLDRDAKALLRDALLSVTTSIHYRILPTSLMIDPRGTVYLFLVVLRGRMFDARYDEATNKMAVSESNYARWNEAISIPPSYRNMTVTDAEGRKVPFGNALYWFGSDLHVEVIKDDLFGTYLQEVESAFSNLEPDKYVTFGKPWTPENFPKAIGPRPSLAPPEQNSADSDATEDEDAT